MFFSLFLFYLAGELDHANARVLANERREFGLCHPLKYLPKLVGIDKLRHGRFPVGVVHIGVEGKDPLVPGLQNRTSDGLIDRYIRIFGVHVHTNFEWMEVPSSDTVEIGVLERQFATGAVFRFLSVEHDDAVRILGRGSPEHFLVDGWIVKYHGLINFTYHMVCLVEVAQVDHSTSTLHRS